MTTREEWLDKAVIELRAICKAHGFDVPQVHVSCGWPDSGGARAGRYVAGVYHPTSTTHDKIGQIFINPRVADSVEVLAILLHELIHASDDADSQHKGDFARRHRDVGFDKPATGHAMSGELRFQLEGVARDLGDYPHQMIELSEKEKKPQKSRMIKCQCPGDQGDCGYIARTARTNIVERGAPVCPTHFIHMEPDMPEEEANDDE